MIRLLLLFVLVGQEYDIKMQYTLTRPSSLTLKSLLGNAAFQRMELAVYIKWDVQQKNMPSSMHKMSEFTSPYTNAKSHPGICSTLKHSIVYNASVYGQ